MDIKISGPKTIDVNAGLPASKSISNRMLVIRELSGGKINVKNLSDCDDTFVMERALKTIHDAVPINKAGAPASKNDTPVINAGAPVTIDIMAAGTSMRFLTALLSTMPADVIITGTERMLHRPIGILVDALRSLGANIDYVGEDGFPPLRIKGGNLRGGAIEMRGDVSSQYISAVMMIAPVMRDGLTLKISGALASRPYMEMTAGLMRMFGAKVVEKQDADGLYIIVKAGGYAANVGEHHTNQATDKPVNEVEHNNETEYSVESDWSAASYWYEMLALAQKGTVRLKGLSRPSLQGDAVVSRLFEPLGVKTEFGNNEALLTKTERTIDYYEADLNTCPDLAQTMVATCCAMGVRFRFDGLQSLRIKETDRLTALRQELEKLGFVIKEAEGRVLYWDGERKNAASAAKNAASAAKDVPSAAQNAVPPIRIATYKDHRMAMCLAPLSMTGAEMIIQDAGVVSKSYPAFWTELENAGFEIETVESEIKR